MANKKKKKQHKYIKALYEQLFNHIFAKINENLDIKNMKNNGSSKTTVIGVLDIYGFEIFDTNSLVFDFYSIYVAISNTF